jgi:hypothetical protein
MSPRNPISPATRRALSASRSWCTSVTTELLGRSKECSVRRDGYGYSIPKAALCLADSQKHEPISMFTRAGNQEMGT